MQILRRQFIERKLKSKLKAGFIPRSYRDRILGHQFKENLRVLLHAVHSPFYWRILKKTIFHSGIILTKIPRNNKTRVYSWIGLCRTEKWW